MSRKTDNNIQRYEIDDKLWDKIKDLLPGRKNSVGRPASDNRNFINAVIYIQMTGIPLRDLPAKYGKPNTVHKRFRRWTKSGVWNDVFEYLKQLFPPNFEQVMIDSSCCKCHPAAAGGVSGNDGIGLTKGGKNTKIHLLCDSFGLPVKFITTAGNVADCTMATQLIEDIKASYLLADKGYDSQDIIDFAESKGMKPVIPLRKNRIEKREYDKDIYKNRYLVENVFLYLKKFRGIATRYVKKLSSFDAIITIACITMYARLL